MATETTAKDTSTLNGQNVCPPPGDNAYALAYYIAGCLASQHILNLDPNDPDRMDLLIDAVHIIARCVQDNPVDPSDEGWVKLPFRNQDRS